MNTLYYSSTYVIFKCFRWRTSEENLNSNGNYKAGMDGGRTDTDSSRKGKEKEEIKEP